MWRSMLAMNSTLTNCRSLQIKRAVTLHMRFLVCSCVCLFFLVFLWPVRARKRSEVVFNAKRNPFKGKTNLKSLILSGNFPMWNTQSKTSRMRTSLTLVWQKLHMAPLTYLDSHLGYMTSFDLPVPGTYGRHWTARDCHRVAFYVALLCCRSSNMRSSCPKRSMHHQLK